MIINCYVEYYITSIWNTSDVIFNITVYNQTDKTYFVISNGSDNFTVNISVNETGDVVLEGEEEVINGTATFTELSVIPKGSYNYTVECIDDNFNIPTYESETPLVISKEGPELNVSSITV